MVTPTRASGAGNTYPRKGRVMPMVSLRRGLAALVVVAALAGVVQAQANHFTNLKVLPKDIPTQDLVGMMNGFTRALGVRCIYCHVGTEGKPFQRGDFAKDDKPTKQKAREMIKMV